MGKHPIKKDEFLSITSVHKQECGMQLFVNLVSGKQPQTREIMNNDALTVL